ncbi:MAG: hypothetical protein L6Q78_12730 [Bacteroidia bacterium]|nr:hypothetical protein [Bacteroidia bacterium]
MKKHLPFHIFLLAILLIQAVNGFTQTNPTAQSLPYSQEFSGFNGSQTTYPSGLQGWTISGSLSSSFPTGAPNGNANLAGGSNASTTAGVYDMNGKAGIVCTGNNLRTLVLSLNTSGASGISMAFIAATQRCENTRVNEIGLQYRIGTSGTFTNISGSTYQNTLTPTSTSGTTSTRPQVISINLPSACENQAVVQLRWVVRDVSGSGNRPSFSIDSIVVGVSSSPSISAGSAPSGFTTNALNTPSLQQGLVVSGTNLTNQVSITPPAGFEISIDSGATFSPTNPIVLSHSSGTLAATKIYIRYNPSSLSQFSGNLEIASTGASTQTVSLTGELANLTPGDIAIIGFDGTGNDRFSFVALKDIPGNTRIWFTDKSWDASLSTPAFTTGEGLGVWTAPSGGLTKGTVVTLVTDPTPSTSLGTGTLASGFSSSGEQVFAFQGSATNPSFICGFTSGSVISTGTPTSAQTWIPAGLTAGENFLATTANNGSAFLSSATPSGTLASLKTFIHTLSNWTTSSTAATFPSWVFTFLENEPTTQPAFGFTTSLANNSLTLNLSGGNGTHVLVIARQINPVTAIPVDGVTYTASGVFGSGSAVSAGEYVVYSGVSGSVSVPVSGLSPGTDYHFSAFSFNGSAGTQNYLTTNPATNVETTTGSSNSANSDIIADALFVEPSNIDFKTALDSSNLSTSNSIEVFKMNLRDGGSSPDADALATELNAISFSISNSLPLKALGLFAGNTLLAEQLVSGNSITFSGLNLVCNDDSQLNLSLRATFKSSQTDNVQFSLVVTGATAAALGSQFVDASAGSATSSTSGDKNRIEVSAQTLVLGQQPGNVISGAAISPAVTAIAKDTFNNTDLDFTGNVTLTTTGTFSVSATTSVAALNGLATFSNLIFDATATGITLTATASGLSNSIASNAFNVTFATLLQFANSWSGTPISVNATTNPLNSATVTLTRGAGITGSSSSARFSSSGFETGSSLVLSNNDYLTFTLQANPGYGFNLNNSTLTISLSSSGTGPASYGVFTSVGGFTQTNQQIGSTLTATSNQTITFPSSGYNGLTNLEIRVYGWNAGATGGTGGISGLTLTGQVVVNTNPAVASSTAALAEMSTSSLSIPSTSTGFDVSGLNLTNNVIVTPPSGYEVSTDSLMNFSSSVNLVPSSGMVSSTRVYVRFNPSALSDQGSKFLTVSSSGANDVSVSLSGVVSNLSIGNIAIIGFNPSTTDALSWVALTDIPQNTIIRFTDNGFSDSLTALSGEGILEYVAPSLIAKGTVVSWSNGMNVTGTGWSSNAPSNFALNASGEQLFAFQGTWTSGQKLLHGLMSGASWTTSGSLASNSTNSYEPYELKSLSASLQFSLANGYLTNLRVNTIESPSILFSRINSNSNWTRSSSQISSVPAYIFQILVDAPTIQPIFSTPSSIGSTTMTIEASGGNGSSVLIAIKQGSSISDLPNDAITYSANATFGLGDSIGTGVYVVYNGPSGSISAPISGLSPSTIYSVIAFSYNGIAGGENYMTSSFNTRTDSTQGGVSTSSLSLTAFFEGLYMGSSTMTAAPYNSDNLLPDTIADTITVVLHDEVTLDSLYAWRGPINTSGLALASFPGAVNGNDYYIAIRHRNSIETWSAAAVSFGSSTSYDFSTAASQAYGDNLIDDGSGVFMVYTGDINQDGSVDFLDYPDLDLDALNGELGYRVTDLNGDASVDFLDYPKIDVNALNGIIKLRP